MERQEIDIRPWGQYRVLHDGATHKVKEILVNPGHRLSYQYHHKRSEHWYVVQGTATVTLDDVDSEVEAGQSVDIPVTMKHRVANKGNDVLVFIEVQTGTYFGEDDIVRLEDDYNRS